MPRFFFDYFDGETLFDNVGIEYPDAAMAQRQAVIALGEVVQDWLGDNKHAGKLTIVIRDDAGVIATAKLDFSADLTTVPPPQQTAS